MALIAQRRHASTLKRCSVLLSAALAAVALLSSSRPSSMTAAANPAGNYALRVCEKCVREKKGDGYNPFYTLAKTAQGAAEAGWPAPAVEYGKCTGACEYGPTVRLVKGGIAIPQIVDGMTVDEEEFKAFLVVTSEQTAERAFGLSSRQIATLAEEGGDKKEEVTDIPE
eukprot:TRINITY_DN10534_c0_g1_i2.p1 TRINITY_DN10534_c0_g1~~TRINITY_DN10534_c0_g1_i2.p1  ORF type:complete len:169 (+),score=52.74 TRINITY_DN10534_c0_g1_i2:112-618(+)